MARLLRGRQAADSRSLEAAPAATVESDVFICYSRRDREFVERLHAALVGAGKEVYVDWEDIPDWTPDYERELFAGIDAADTFLFVLSPDSLSSPNCGLELERAVAQGKRMRPLDRRGADGAVVPDVLRKPQWIDFRRDDGFDEAAARLLEAIDIDADWARQHTRFGLRANQWAGRDGDGSFLLRGSDLRDAQGWLAGQAGKEPAPTELQLRYVDASRRAASRRQRVTLGAVLFALAVALGLAVFALLQRDQAISQRDTAQSRELAARALAALPNDPAESLRMAVDAMHAKSTVGARDALRQSLLDSHVRHVLAASGQTVNLVAFSPNGKLVVTAPGEADFPPRVWEAETGREVSVLRGFQVGQAVAFSPDSQFVVIAGQQLRVYSSISGQRIALRAPLGYTTNNFDRVFFSPNGKLLASGSVAGKIFIWNTASWKPTEVLAGTPMAFSPDGTHLLTIERRRALIRETRGGKPRARLTGYGVACGAYSPDGRVVVTVSPKRASVLSTRTWRVVKRLEGGGLRKGGCEAFFSADGRLFSTGSQAWRTSTWKRVPWNLSSGVDIDLPESLSPDWRLIVAPRVDRSVQVRDTATGETVAVLRGHTGLVPAADFSPDGLQIVTASDDGTARLWATPHTTVSVLGGLHGHVESAAFSRNGQLVVTAGEDVYGDGTVRVWRARTGEQIAVPIHLPNPCRALSPRSSHTSRPTLGRVALSPDGKLLLVGTPMDIIDRNAQGCSGSITRGSGYTQVWDTDKWKRVAVLRGSEYAVSPDGRLVATITAVGIRVHEVGTWNTITAAGGVSVDFSPIGDLVVSVGRTVKVWHAKTGKQVAVLRGNQDRAAFSPDGKLIVTTDYDGTARIWDPTRGERIRVLPKGAAELRAAFSPDGKLLATSSDRTRLWDVSTWKEIANVAGQFMSFNPGADLFVTASADGSVQVWNSSGERVMEILPAERTSENYYQELGAAAFSPNGRLLVTALNDETARVFDCEVCRPIGELLHIAEERVATMTSEVTPRKPPRGA